MIKREGGTIKIIARRYRRRERDETMSEYHSFLYDQLNLFFKNEQNRAIYKTADGYLEILENRLYEWLVRVIKIKGGELETTQRTFNAERMAIEIGFREMAAGDFMEWDDKDRVSRETRKENIG